MTTPATESVSDQKARWLIRAAAIAQSAFFACVTYYLMAYVKRDGFEFVPVMLMALIFLLLVLPSLLLSLFRRGPLLLPALMCLFALAFNFMLFGEIVSSVAR